MKKIIYQLTALSFVLIVSSCNFIDYDLNIDPNNPVDAPMENLLPSAQTTYAFVLGGDFGRFVSIWAQQHAGVDRQHSSYEVYQVKENDLNNAWSNMYSGALMDFKLVMDKADASESPHFKGVAQIMTASAMATIVDLFDAVPYSQALNGTVNEGLNPGYDSGADIYAAIDGLLREGAANCSSAASTFSPGAGDLVYGGDMSAWVAAANSLRARYAVRLGNYQGALTALADGGIADNSGDAQLAFGSTSASGNPWHLFEVNRGDVVMGGFLMDLMNSIDDPRRPAFATTNENGEYRGAAAGVPDNTPAVSRFGPYYASIGSPIPFVTYAETKFLEAEALLETGDLDGAAAAHNEAIIASLNKFGTYDQAYVDAQASETSNTISKEKIITHKYIALYTTQEPYNDWRRTGIPDLQPAAGQSAVARRFPYPQDERLFNAANWPGNVNIFTDRVFWDN